MTFTFEFLLAGFIVATVSALPADHTGEARDNIYSEHHLAGASGTFRYPASGSNYANNERVLITAGFPENTIFVLENYNLESSFDTLTIHKWSGDDLEFDRSFTGFSSSPKYFLPEGNFLLAFESDATSTHTGFNLSWGPLESFLQQQAR